MIREIYERIYSRIQNPMAGNGIAHQGHSDCASIPCAGLDESDKLEYLRVMQLADITSSNLVFWGFDSLLLDQINHVVAQRQRQGT